MGFPPNVHQKCLLADVARPTECVAVLIELYKNDVAVSCVGFECLLRVQDRHVLYRTWAMNGEWG